MALDGLVQIMDGNRDMIDVVNHRFDQVFGDGCTFLLLSRLGGLRAPSEYVSDPLRAYLVLST